MRARAPNPGGSLLASDLGDVEAMWIGGQLL